MTFLYKILKFIHSARSSTFPLLCHSKFLLLFFLSSVFSSIIRHSSWGYVQHMIFLLSILIRFLSSPIIFSTFSFFILSVHFTLSLYPHLEIFPIPFLFLLTVKWSGKRLIHTYLTQIDGFNLEKTISRTNVLGNYSPTITFCVSVLFIRSFFSFFWLPP